MIKSISLLFAAGLAFAADPTAVRLAERAVGDTPLLSDLRELCDGIGGRPTGSPACNRAVEWAARKFREAGADKVTVESFPVPHLWLGVSGEAAATAPESFPLRIARPLQPLH